MNGIYLDYASTTPIDDEVQKEMQKYGSFECGLFGNPSSLHLFGQKADSLLQDARERVAKKINSHSSEVFFFSSATEANNFAIRSVVKKYKKQTSKKPHIIISSIEHPSVTNTAKDLEQNGEVELTILKASSDGYVKIEEILDFIKENTVLVSVIYVQNEIGTVQDVGSIKKILEKTKNNGTYPLIHTDASQAYLVNLNVKELKVDMMTLSGHKIYGPKGVSALYINGRDFDIRDICEPITTGGGQEKGMRSGTENIQAIIGFAKALEIVENMREKEYSRILELSRIFFESLKKNIKNVEMNGGDNRSPHILNIYLPEIDRANILLDMNGIAASSGSACSQRIPKKSDILSNIGFSDDRITKSIRFSFGRHTTKNEIDEVVNKIIMLYQKNKSDR